jgi:hypothetical protein
LDEMKTKYETSAVPSLCSCAPFLLLLLVLLSPEVRNILISARTQVKALLTERLDQLHMLAGALVEHETLNATQIKVGDARWNGGGGGVHMVDVRLILTSS